MARLTLEDILLQRDMVSTGGEDAVKGLESEAAQATHEQGVEFLKGWQHTAEGPSLEEYDYGAAVGEGFEFNEQGQPFLPHRYVKPGGKTFAGRDVATSRAVTPLRSPLYVSEEAAQAEYDEDALPVRVAAKGLLQFVQGTGLLSKNIAASAPEGSYTRDLFEFLGKLDNIETPEALEKTSGLLEDLAVDFTQFALGFAAAPVRVAKLGLADEAVRGAQAAQTFDPEEGNIGTLLAQADLLPDALTFLDSKGTSEDHGIWRGRLALAVEEGALTYLGAAGIYTVLALARRYRKAAGDTVIEKGVDLLRTEGGTRIGQAQRGQFDPLASTEEGAPQAAQEPPQEAAAHITEAEDATQQGLAQTALGLQMKGFDEADIMRQFAEDGVEPERAAAAITRAQEMGLEARAGTEAAKVQAEVVNTLPPADAPPTARSRRLQQREQVNPVRPYPGKVEGGEPEAVDTVTQSTGAGLLPEGDVTFNGKDIPDWTPEDWQGFGQQHGVSNLGPLTDRVEVLPGVEIPGGMDGEFTYVDLLWLKSQLYNPRDWPDEVSVALQKKLSRSTTPDPEDDMEVFNRMVFGMLSPNNPLTANEFEYAMVRARNMDDVRAWAGLAPEAESTGARTKAQQQEAQANTDRISEMFGTQAAARGGLGLHSTPQFTDVAEFAQQFLKDPDFFRKGADESWHQFVERVMSQTRGQSAKVASFSLVWQDPLHASISAVDRHMAAMFKDKVLNTPEARADFEKLVVQRWNVQAAKGAGEPAENMDDVMAQTGGSTVMGEVLMSTFTQHPSAKMRTPKGEFGKNVPQHLREANWVNEPEKVQMIGEAYKQALAVNDALAIDQGLHLFSSQWMLWDRLRGRLEPHEVMFPGLYKLPKPSRSQMQRALQEHKDTGFMGHQKRAVTKTDEITGEQVEGKEAVPLRETKKAQAKGGKMEWWKGAYFSVVPMLGAGGAFEESADER